MYHAFCLVFFFFFSSRRRHTRCSRDWSSDVCSSDLRVVARAEAAARGVLWDHAAVRRLEDVEVVRGVPEGERALGRGLGGAHTDVRQRREAVRLHEPPRQAEPLHPERVLGPVVEAPVRVRVHEGGRDHARRRHGPDLPPDFSTSWTLAIVTPFSTPLIMSYTVSAATLTAVSASISTPVLSTVLTRASTASSPRRRSSANVTSTPVRRSGWQRGMSWGVRLAARMPAVRATPRTSPLGALPRRMTRSVAGAILRTARATASRTVSRSEERR